MKDLCEASYYRHLSNVIYFKITFLNLLHYVELYLCHAAQLEKSSSICQKRGELFLFLF